MENALVTAVLDDFRNRLKTEITTAVEAIVSRTLADLKAEQDFESSRLLNEKEIIILLGISRSALRTLRRQKSFPVLKVGKSNIRFDKAAVLAFIKQRNA
jgi:predicted DNA-binding transcriptional regulator AlpA